LYWVTPGAPRLPCHKTDDAVKALAWASRQATVCCVAFTVWAVREGRPRKLREVVPARGR
jgi:hypothetical protein